MVIPNIEWGRRMDFSQLFSQSGQQPLHADMFIDGRWHSGDHPRIEVDNPANESLLGTIGEGNEAIADAALAAASRAQHDWGRRPAIERGRLVACLAAEVAAHSEQLARIICLEQGKPLAQAQGEVEAASNFLDYSSHWARRIEGEIVASDNPHEEIQIRSLPVGVVVALTAWNYPAALAARKLGPALVAGNTVVLLSHEITPFSGLFIAALAERVGFPPGVINVVTGRGAQLGRALVEDPRSDLISMTGSTRAGREIFRSAADELKILRLELGGKAPFIVMEDADIDKAVAAAVAARYTNCGQICTCNERMYLHESIADEFSEKFVAASQRLTIGDPFSNPDLGPKVSRVEVDKIDQLVSSSVEAGAQMLLKGGPLNEGDYANGYWYAPTVIETRQNTSPLITQEAFGPVAVIQRVSDFEQALAFANDSDYGLSAYVFTRNMQRLMRLPQELRFAELYINRSNGEQVQGYHSGWRHSGIGGEDGKHGFSAYLKKQTTYLNWED